MPIQPVITFLPSYSAAEEEGVWNEAEWYAYYGAEESSEATEGCFVAPETSDDAAMFSSEASVDHSGPTEDLADAEGDSIDTAGKAATVSTGAAVDVGVPVDAGMGAAEDAGMVAAEDAGMVAAEDADVAVAVDADVGVAVEADVGAALDADVGGAVVRLMLTWVLQ
ncbi:unnamed protein product [Closterium sp. Yama58-4]|nr:unnamed protein product [Closterium sp. Yama58-4]